MAGSRRSLPAESRADSAPALGEGEAPAASDTALRAAVARSLERALPEGGRVGVALSGGRDSIVLLDVAAAVGAAARCELVALHVHHGLSPHADEWMRFCGDACAARGIRLAARRVEVARGPRISLEAAARGARYTALDALAREQRATAVLLAHHADDQAETVLLQLLRGAGPRGLAAMPAARVDSGLWWLRPFLGLPRATIEAYALRHALRYVDDASNADPRHRRNALRASVVPALRALAPGYPQTLVRAATHQAEAASLLDELAALDARSACDGATLDCAALRALDAPRARNLLRWFVREQGLPAPSAARLAEMLRQATGAGADARIAIAHAGAELGVHRGRLALHRRAPEPYLREWTGASTLELAHGTLLLAPVAGAGIAARHLASSRVTIRNGAPGERLRVPGRASHRAVADLLREAGVPKWDRLALPRVYCDDALAAVAGAGVDAAFAAARGEAGIALDWRPAPAGR